MKTRSMWLAASLALAACAGGGGGGGGGGGAGGGTIPDGSVFPDTGAGGSGFGGGFGDGGAGGSGPVGNQRPELMRIGDKVIEVGQTFELTLSATDPDNDPLVFNVRSTLPDGAKFEKETGRFTWTPGPGQLGTLVLLTFEVSDGTLKDQETIQVSVVGQGEGGQQPPEIESPGDQVATAGRELALQVVATDPNGDEITYSLRGAESLTGAGIDAKTGRFTWTPPVDAAGQEFTVTFVASDGTAEATAEARIVVREPGAAGQNLPPRPTPIPDQEVRVGQPVTFQVTATDDNPAALRIEPVGSLPPGAVFDEASATFSWTPGPDAANQSFRVVFSVSDGEFRSIARATINVLPADGPVPGDCTADPGEPDAQPVELAPGTTLERTVCPANDTDDYLFTLEAGQSFTFDVRFAHAAGDLDVEVTGPGGYAARADSSDDDEQVVGLAAESGEYIARVFGYQGVTNPAYSVSLTVEEGGGPAECTNDGAESNDDADNPAPMRDFLDAPLQICPGDQDFFLVELEAGTSVSIRARFSHAAGDLDMDVVEPRDARRIPSYSGDDDEEVVLDPVATSGTYLVHVFGYENAQNTYTLELEEGAPAPCDADRVEPNDTVANAEPFSPEVYNNLTWCGEPDWYKTQVGPGQELQVFVSFDGASAPTMMAFDAGEIPIPGQTFEVAQGDGCKANRAACRRLRARPQSAGWVFYDVTQWRRGQSYDFNVRVVDVQGGEECSPANQSCDDFSVCDYPGGTCVGNFCDERTPCPGDYLCHQSYCVELCSDDLECARDGYACKMLGDLEMCGRSGDGPVGGPCWDFTDCGGSLDCLLDAGVPGGYCSRECTADNQCGAGGRCGRFDNGNFCGKTCGADGDCRDGYACTERQMAGGGTARLCTPR